MKFTKTIKSLASKYPVAALYGYQALKQYWRVKAQVTNFDYPEKEELASIKKEKVVAYNSNRILGPKKRICYAPFNNIHFSMNGKVALCSFNIDHYVGNIQEETIREIWFGEKAKAFRNQLASYNFEKCMNCKSVLDSGNYAAFPPAKYDLLGNDNSEYPTQMSFEISNLCNLECVMCSGEFSSSIQANREKVPVSKYRYPENFIGQLREFIPHLKIATFIGGEPTLIKAYYDIWEEIIRTNPSCAIHVQTNATKFPDKFLRLLDSGQFDIGISIDAVSKELYEKIRVNAVYEDVQENIDYLISLHEKGKVYLNMNFCPLAINWHELPEMVAYATRKNITLKILNVDGPNDLALRYRSSSFLKTVYEKLHAVNVAPERKGVVASRNGNSFRLFVASLPPLISEVEGKELQENKFHHLPKAEIEELFRKDISENEIYAMYTTDEKKKLFAACMNYLHSKKLPDAVHRAAIGQIVLLSSNTKGDKNSDKTITDLSADFRRLTDGFIRLSGLTT